jgi:hypothetical protein
VAVVPGVLLDHVEKHPAHAHLGLLPRMEERLVQVVTRGRLPSQFDLLLVDGEIVLGVGLFDAIEVPVRVGVAAIEGSRLLAPDPAPEPASLDLGHVADEPEQRQA